MENVKWFNYGDVNPIEHGGMFVKADTDVIGRCFYVINVIPFEDDVPKWMITNAYIDLNDDWIEWESIQETMDTPKDATDELYAVDVVQYYGNHAGAEMLFEDEKDLINFLNENGVEI